jgi:hypothetical protein
MCGPKEGKTSVRLHGSGFIAENPDEIVFSMFDTIAVEQLQRDAIEQEVWN